MDVFVRVLISTRLQDTAECVEQMSLTNSYVILKYMRIYRLLGSKISTRLQ